MLIAIFAAVYLIQLSKQQCGRGCIKCSDQDQCQLCDFPSNYYLNGTTCISASLPNCSLLSNDGKCLICKSTFFPDQTTGKCAQVTSNFLVANCTAYSAGQVCLGCPEGMFISDSKCVASNKTLDNCDTYRSEGVCLICKLGFFLSLDGQNCLAAPSDANCQSFSQIKCASCLPGFVYDPNTFVSILSQSLETVVSYLLRGVNKGRSLAPQIVCQPSSVSNCLEYKAANKCAVCQPGFFLTSAETCQANPVPPIPNCLAYKSLTSCQQCQDFYYLLTDTNCSAIVPQDNCEHYDPSYYRTRCVRCSADYILNSSDECVLRTTSLFIENCETKDPAKEICSACKAGFVVTDDGLKCLSASPNCNLYSPSSNSTTTLSCASCVDGYYLNSGSCVLGSVDSCQVFLTNQNACKTCANGFYLADGKCLPQPPLNNCTTYNSSLAASCIQCSNSSALFSLENFCATLKQLPNCVNYNSEGLCSACSDGFNLVSGGCVKFPDSAINCAVYDQGSSKCTACQTGFVLDAAAGVCLSAPAFLTLNCASPLFEGTFLDQPPKPSCAYCNNFAVPVNLKNHFLCVSPDYLKYYGVANQIANCTKYNENGNCLQCKDSQVVLASGVCGAACPDNSALLSFDYLTGRVNNCVPNTLLANCPRLIVRGTNLYACLQLSAGFVPLVSMADKNIVPFRIDEQGREPDYLAYQGSLFTPTSVSPIANCLTYYNAGTGNGCLKCIQGFSGGLDSKSTITSCDAIVDCSPTFISGLPQLLNKVMSCHVCKTATNLPFVGVKGNNLDWTALKVPANANTVVSCAAKPVSLPDKCAVVFELTDATTPANSGTFCGACQPGYRPTFADNTNKVTACTEITNCLPTATKIFNGCSFCSAGFAFSYTNSAISQTQCLPTSLANCLVLNADSTCRYCFSGFYKNRDGVCERLDLPFCAPGKSQPFYSITTLVEFSMLAYYGQPDGCTGCATGSVAVKTVSNLSVCLPSAVLAGNLLYSPNLFIPHCSGYSESNGNYICRLCTSGFILDASNLKCVPSLTNCAVAQTSASTLCQTCLLGFVLKTGVCIPGDVSFCVAFEPTTTTDPNCSLCQEGYYLKSKRECAPGQVLNCLGYPSDNPKECSRCRVGFHLALNSDGIFYCFPIEPSLNCTKLDPSKFLENKIFCLECAKNEATGLINRFPSQKASDFPFKTICMPLLKIPNCLLYNLQSPRLSTFECVECAPEFLLNSTTGQCQNRTKVIDGCQSYALNAELCQTCGPEFLMASDKASCIPYPYGIIGCIKYSDPKKCAVCDSSHFLQLNTCLPVPSLIPNCLKYYSIDSCEICQNGYMASSGGCLKANATDCMNYTDLLTCAACAAGRGLKTNIDGVTNCELITKQHCLSFGYQPPYNCTVCEDGYFSGSAGDCVPVDKPIGNCVRYSSGTVCSQCKPGFVLQTNGTLCLNDPPLVALTDPKCQSAVLLNQTFCSECKIGSFLQNNTCVSCANPKSAVGCRACLGSATDKCLVCASDYFMNKNGSCVAAGILPQNNTNNTNSTQEIGRLKVFMWTGIFVGLMFR